MEDSIRLKNWSGQRDPNPRHQAWEACTLPTELCPLKNSLSGEKSSGRAPRRSRGPSGGDCGRLPIRSETRYTRNMQGSGRGRDGSDRPEFLYFFPDQRVTAEEVRHLLRQGTTAQRAWVISHLLRYAVWDDIWAFVSRDDVREIFPELDLPENLRAAWARMLKV